MKVFSYTVTDPLGMHARPAGLFVKEAAHYNSKIEIVKGDKKADGKRIFGVMGLAVKCGEEVAVTIDGTDEDEALETLERFMKENL